MPFGILGGVAAFAVRFVVRLLRHFRARGGGARVVRVDVLTYTYTSDVRPTSFGLR